MTINEQIVGKSQAIKKVFNAVARVAPTDSTVLITGETGVGKELIARAAHDASGLRGGFVPVNAAGLDDTLFTDTLFGHGKGAFTSADKPREGIIAQASGGTRLPAAARPMAVAQAEEVLPTPPFPVKNRIRVGFGTRMAISEPS